jgi:FkbH-like protein
MDSPDAEVAWLRLRDRHGDLGLVGVGIIRRLDDELWVIDTFLMSCRVMGRHVEDAFLSYLAELAIAAGAMRLRGVYRETRKNAPVRDFYSQRGFVEIGSDADDERAFEAGLHSDAFRWPAAIQRVPQENPRGSR